MRTVDIYDCTLRDGTQGEGVAFSVDDKIRITRRLDELGVHYIEGGWPGSNPRDAGYFERAKDLELKNAKVTAFGMTRRANLAVEDDPNLQSLLDAETPVTTVVGKTWTLHVRDVLRTTLDENLRMIQESVAYLKSHDKRVVYDAEHFFDGYKADPEYALETLRAAQAGRADVVVLCDTNGGTMPWEIESITREMGRQIDVPLGVHTHDDSGVGVANTLAGVRAGATHVQGTINGYGERVGNANLCAIIPDLKLKMGLDCVTDEQLRNLTETSRYVSELANLTHNYRQAYVGASAFAHKGGIHVAAVMRNVDSYQHIEPKLVGNNKRVLVSDLSGRGNVLYKASEFGLEDVDKESAAQVVERIKELENEGFTFESAEASVDMMLRRTQPDYAPPFQLVDFMVVVEHREGRGLLAEATVKVRIDGAVVHTAAEGNGPVNALDAALRKALLPSYPQLMDFQLIDYKVRILDSEEGTAAKTRVLIDTSSGYKQWSTVGASTNIIAASWRALVDSVEYGLLR
ncbi:MAG: (R)-citramalate synthase [Anaerolineales bacterium]|nr:(R)-citramalate synthase [Anaerolineales bacterium]